MTGGPDPILLEVYRHRFEALCEEMAAALERSAFSANIKERRDDSCALFDSRGQMVAQGDHMPVHLGSMPLSVAAALDEHRLGPGDLVILNDPWKGGTHLPDLTVVAPFYVDPTDPAPAFHLANRAHHADVGGMTSGSMPLSREIYQEGLRLPPVRLVVAGETREDLLEVILANVRTPEERRGDLRAQEAAVHRGRRRLRAMVERSGLEEVTAYAAHLRAYTERRVRATLAEIPDGSWSFEDVLEGDGLGAGEIAIRVAVEVRGDELVVDFGGTAPQVDGPLNANRAVTLSACAYVLRCLSPAEIPFNSGCFAPLTVHTTPGSVVDARPPAAVCGGNVETSQRIVDVVMGALAQALPDRIPAASQGTMNNLTFGGRRAGTGEPFTYYETIAGGSGGGPAGPGASGIHTHMTNTRNTPIEALEHEFPVRVEAYGLRRGSGGAGRHRGGDGVVRQLRFEVPVEMTVLSERRAGGPWGLAGGAPGRPGRNLLVRGCREEELPAKAKLRLEAGDTVRIETPGGGGWGPAGGEEEG